MRRVQINKETATESEWEADGLREVEKRPE